MDKNISLKNAKKIHMIGIGGSGMCPLAEILAHKGHEITGSDNYDSDTLTRLKNKNFKIHMGHNAQNVVGCDLVAYSAAIKSDNPEIIAAKEQNIPLVGRAELLGLVAAEYKNLIAVSGTHGKTSTTAMITQILTESGADPTAVVGGKVTFLDGNSRIGSSESMVCEACEYVDSFLQLTPTVAVILNVEADHLDYFKSIDGVINSFSKFAQKTTNLIVVNGDDKNSLKVIQNATTNNAEFFVSQNDEKNCVSTYSEQHAQNFSQKSNDFNKEICNNCSQENTINPCHFCKNLASHEFLESAQDTQQFALSSIITFGEKENNDYYVKNVVESHGICESFDVYKNDKKILTTGLSVPGRHNMLTTKSLLFFNVTHTLEPQCF